MRRVTPPRDGRSRVFKRTGRQPKWRIGTDTGRSSARYDDGTFGGGSRPIPFPIRRTGGLRLTWEAGVPGTLARYGAAVAAVLFGMAGSAAWADDPFGPQPLASPQDSPEVPSAGR